MENIINVTGIQTTDFIQGRKGQYRTIVKVRGGFYSSGDVQMTECIEKDPSIILQSYKPKALHTVEFKPEGGNYWLTVFARSGKKVQLLDKEIMEKLTVGTINSYFPQTQLHDHNQYKAVNAKTWADKAFTQNK